MFGGQVEAPTQVIADYVTAAASIATLVVAVLYTVEARRQFRFIKKLYEEVTKVTPGDGGGD